MGSGEGNTYLNRNIEDLIKRKVFVRDQFADGATLNEFRCDKTDATRFAYLVNSQNVGMIQS